MILTGFAVAPLQSDAQVYAADNDTLLKVTLTGAKASTYPDYYEPGEQVYVPSTARTDDNPASYYGAASTAADIAIAQAAGRAYAGAKKPNDAVAYDAAYLYVYNPKAESWTEAAYATLFDYEEQELAKAKADKVQADAEKAADDIRDAAYTAAAGDPTLEAAADEAKNTAYKIANDNRVAAELAIDSTIYKKAAFEFHYDKKYNKMDATIVYVNNAQTKKAYGQYVGQTIGGYFGDFYDYVDNDVAAIETFKLAKGSKKFALKKAVFETLKVTPKDTPINENGLGVDYSKETYVDTNASAELITDQRGGTVTTLYVPQVTLTERKWDGALNEGDGGYKYTYLLGDPNAGTYIFPALAGQKLIFSAGGSYQDGTRNARGELKADEYFYQGQYLGGYKSDYNVIGNPKSLKKVTVTKKNKAVGTIKLAKATAKITGTIPNDDTGYSITATGLATDQKVTKYGKQEEVKATFAEYKAAYDGKTTSKKNVDREYAYLPATEAEYLAYFNTPYAPYTLSPATVYDPSLFDTSNLIQVPTLTEYNKLPEIFQNIERDPLDGVTKYYKPNVVEVADSAAYNALPDQLQFGYGSIDGKYYAYKYSVVVDTDTDPLDPGYGDAQDEYYDLPYALYGGIDYNTTPFTYYKKDYVTFYKSTAPLDATEAEYINYVSDEYPDVVSATSSYRVTAIDKATSDSLHAPTGTGDNNTTYWLTETYDANGQSVAWDDPTAVSFFKKNYSVTDEATYNALLDYTVDYTWTIPDYARKVTLRYDIIAGESVPVYVYYKADYISPITKAQYEALPDSPNLKVSYLSPATDAVGATPAAPAKWNYYKIAKTYSKIVAPYRYWKLATTYIIENVRAGVYAVSWGGQVKIITVKNGKTVKANFKAQKDVVNDPSVHLNVTGIKKKGQKLTAESYIETAQFGSGNPTYKYYWTDGAKVVSKKAALKLSKTTAKKNLWVISVATIGANSYPATGWYAAPGNTWGKLAFAVDVTGTFKKGKKVTAEIVGAEAAGVTYTYQWLRNGKAIKKATKATYKLTKADKKKKISVRVIATRDGFTAKTVKSKATKAK
jgi:hypothetical protein